MTRPGPTSRPPPPRRSRLLDPGRVAAAMAERRKLIVVSNRGPVTYGSGPDGERVARRGGGGLVTALRSLVSLHDVTWIASAMSDEDRAVAAENGAGAIEERARDGSPFRLRLVAHDQVAYDWFYNVVANPMLWFLQHYLWELAYDPTIDVALQNAWDDGYARVNRTFADAVLEELTAEPSAAVFFHDYHLYLAPAFVRERAPDALLAHFIHVPWPQTDYWHVLPDRIRRAVHEGVLANDVVGFHTHQWRLNFLRAASDVAELASSEPVLVAERELVARRPEKLVLRVDRTDPSKNIVRGFRAFELYLEGHEEMHRRVAMVALLDPSRQDIPEYAEYLAAIQREARRVNDRFQRDRWTPIELVIEDDFAASVAAYKQFDALFVNAIYDGMNLVAKEAPLVNERGGVLILSENAGAHAELGEWALTVNPFDVAGQAEAIDHALTMDEADRRARLEAIRAHVREHDVSRWIETQLADL